MSTDQLGPALRDLVDGVEDDARAPSPDALWAGGRRRRRTSRAVPVLAAACVAGVVALLAWPGGAPRASVPAVGVDDRGNVRLASYPAAIAKPPLLDETDRPGVTAAVVTEYGDTLGLYAVSPGGAVTRLSLPDLPVGLGAPALSPDGRWLARGAVLDDLVSGGTLSFDSPGAGVPEASLPTDGAVWWAPDSRRAYVAGFGQGSPPSSMGVVLGVDGGVSEVPLLLGGVVAVEAGWIDDETLVALAGLGPRAERLEIHTWRVGDADWSAAGPVVSWLGGPRDGEGGVVSVLRASMSPDGSRMLLTASLGEDGTASEQSRTRAVVVDPRTGSVLGMPDADGTWPPGDQSSSFAEQEGWGCRPAWRNGLPLSTDRGVRAMGGSDDDLVTLSSRFEGACPVFAGDELSGVSVPNTAAVWEERAWVFGLPLFLIALVGLVVWRLGRRRNRWRERPRWLPMIWAQRF